MAHRLRIACAMVRRRKFAR